MILAQCMSKHAQDSLYAHYMFTICSLVHVQNFFGGWQAVSLGGGMTVMEKREILVGWVTKVCLECAKSWGREEG